MKKLILVLGFLLVFTGTSMATVCDDAGLTGAAWGLCNSYCEIMDCDSDFPIVTEEVCIRTANRFTERTSGDILPCELTDTDGDTVPDNVDNCVDVVNVDQSDIDDNGLGDACDCPCWSSDSLYQMVMRILESHPNYVLETCFHEQHGDEWASGEISVTKLKHFPCKEPPSHSIKPYIINEFRMQFDSNECFSSCSYSVKVAEYDWRCWDPEIETTTPLSVVGDCGPSSVGALQQMTECIDAITRVCTALGY